MTMAQHKSKSILHDARDAFPGSDITDAAFCAWLSQAKAGDALIYYRGFLAADTETDFGGLSIKQRRALRALGDAAFRAAQQNLVHLVQARLATDRFAYLAIVRPTPPEQKSDSVARLLAAA